MLKTWFHRLVLTRRWATFVAMGLSFFAFGAGSLNLFYLLKANTGLLAEHGWEAVADGGLQQLIELLLTGYLSLAAYLVFKVCEYSLVHALADAAGHKPKTAGPAADDSHNR